MQYKKGTFLYSFIAPLGLGYLTFSFLFPFTQAVLILNILVNTIFLLVISLSVLFLTKNSSRISFKNILLVSFAATLLQDLYSLVIEPFIYSDPSRNLRPVFSYSLTPALYNQITQILFPGIICFLALFFLLRKKHISNLFLICLAVSILNLSWIGYFLNNLPPKSNDLNSDISQKQVNKIKDQIKFNITAEKLIPDPKTQGKYNSLEITTEINVPETGTYTIQPILVQENKRGSTLFDDGPRDYYINGNPITVIGDLNLIKGKNTLNFEFPYSTKQAGEEVVNLTFADKVNGSYGPYFFKVIISELKTDKGRIILNYSSEDYQTKTYKYQDFYN